MRFILPLYLNIVDYKKHTRTLLMRSVIIDVTRFDGGSWVMRLLWDLDGTIFDTYPDILESFIDLHKEVFGHTEGVDRKEALRWLKKTSKEALEHYNIPASYIDRFKELHNERSEKGSPLFPGVDKVFAAADVNVMVTHREKEATIDLLKKWALDHHFDEIISPECDGFPRKPDPQVYQHLHDKYQLDWAIGDRALDLIPAKHVGMKTVAFQNPDIEADIHVDHYTEELIEQLKK